MAGFRDFQTTNGGKNRPIPPKVLDDSWTVVWLYVETPDGRFEQTGRPGFLPPPMLENRDYLRRPGPAVDHDGPSALWVLVMINLGALVLRQLFTADNGLPAGALSVTALQEGGWWTVFTHLFIHSDWSHLLPNLALLIFAGRRLLEDIGTRHFLYIYLVSGWVGAAVILLLHPQSPLIGASACVSGVIGAYAALHPERSITKWMGAWAPRLRAVSAFRGLVISFAMLEIFASVISRETYYLPMIHDIAHGAHAAGLLTGWLYARHLAPALGNFYHREDFFPQGLRRRRDTESPPVSAKAGVRQGGLHAEPDSPAAAPVPLSNDEFLRQAVDPVLDKLYASGMASLTPAERKILDEAANRFARRDP